MTTPDDLGTGGRSLWESITTEHTLDASQLALLEAACRQRDRADSLAAKAGEGDVSALRHEREASLAMARLVSALRLPDPRTGKRPQLRSLRGVHTGPAASPAPLSSLERARRRAEGKAS
jgi:hypothetical protein